MPQFRIAEAAALLGVSDDTVRRWVDQGRLRSHRGATGPQTIEGTELASAAQQLTAQQLTSQHHDERSASVSARNRLRGIVTGITSDAVMSQVELQAGPFRLVSLVSSESVRELGLEVGSVAVASMKATSVVMEVS